VPHFICRGWLVASFNAASRELTPIATVRLPISRSVDKFRIADHAPGTSRPYGVELALSGLMGAFEEIQVCFSSSLAPLKWTLKWTA
jgi:hypothetical protein